MAVRKLHQRRCVPCTGRTRPLTAAQAKALLADVPGWRLARGRLKRTVTFDDFLSAMEFVNEMAAVAEEEQHHPDFRVSWSRLDIEIRTHALDRGKGGLSENDFILAAKINQLLGERE